MPRIPAAIATAPIWSPASSASPRWRCRSPPIRRSIRTARRSTALSTCSPARSTPAALAAPRPRRRPPPPAAARARCAPSRVGGGGGGGGGRLPSFAPPFLAFSPPPLAWPPPPPGGGGGVGGGDHVSLDACPLPV